MNATYSLVCVIENVRDKEAFHKARDRGELGFFGGVGDHIHQEGGWRLLTGLSVMSKVKNSDFSHHSFHVLFRHFGEMLHFLNGQS